MKLDRFCNTCTQFLDCYWIEFESEHDRRFNSGHRSFRAYHKPLHGSRIPDRCISKSEKLDGLELFTYNYEVLMSGVLSPCQLCALFRFNHEGYAGYTPLPDKATTGLVEIETRRSGEIWRLVLDFPNAMCNLRCRPISSLNALGLSGIRDNLPGLTNVEPIFRWLEDCDLRHSECGEWRQMGQHSLQSQQRFPSRLVDVGTNSEQHVRIVDRDELPDDIAYATLSHCWRTKLPLRLTSKTRFALYHGFPVLWLPPTFRDAVVFTRDLMIRYIWIDAVCILQDSVEDWQKEASGMSFIYSQGFVNIAATASTDSSGGLFCQYSDFNLGPHELLTSWTGHITNVRDIILTEFSPRYRSITYAPLNKRAWVFQESILSRRTVHFAQNSIEWHCHHSSISDVVFEEESDPDLPYVGFKGGSWEDVIMNYSRLNLTYMSDKLMAIAGIAQLFGRMHSMDRNSYLASLWIEEIPTQLLWYALKASRKPHVRGFPTWSWAAVDGPVLLRGPMMPWKTSLSSLTDRKTCPSTSNPFVSIDDAHLKLKGHLIHCTLERSALQDVEGRSVGQDVILNKEYVFKIPQDPQEAHNAAETHLDCALAFFDHIGESNQHQINANVWFLPMMSRSHSDSGEDSWGFLEKRDYTYELSGLLIQQVQEMTGVYQRVGALVLHCDKSRWSRKLWTSYDLEKENYTKKYDDGQYSITLV